MAIKYYEVPEKRQVIAVMNNTQYDSINKIRKIMNQSGYYFSPMSEREMESYMMPDDFKVVVTCDERDEYSFEVGKQIAKNRLLKNYRKSLDKRIGKFHESVTQFVINLKSENS